MAVGDGHGHVVEQQTARVGVIMETAFTIHCEALTPMVHDRDNKRPAQIELPIGDPRRGRGRRHRRTTHRRHHSEGPGRSPGADLVKLLSGQRVNGHRASPKIHVRVHAMPQTYADAGRLVGTGTDGRCD